jgi:tetratricopeptide (TPR) repeat protein
MLVRLWLCLGLIVGLSLCACNARADADGEARKAFEQGVAASNEERWQDARRAFQHSLERVVKPSTLFNLAVADVKLGLIEEALAALDRFERLANPKQHAGMLERAATLRAQAERNRDAARPANERARGLIEPGNLSATAQDSYVQGRDAYARGDDKLALEAFERAHRESGKNELLFDIGIAADRLRADERAVDALSRFVDLFPELPEADQARRHLDRLNRVIAERTRPEPAATITARREEGPAPTAAPAGTPLELTAPRSLIIVGAVMAAAAVGSAGWLIERSGAREDRCLRDQDACENFERVQREKRAALGLTISLSVAAVGMLTGGAIWLRKRKQAGVALRDLQVQTSAHQWLGTLRFAF